MGDHLVSSMHEVRRLYGDPAEGVMRKELSWETAIADSYANRL